jgi:phosphatidylinositol alpha-1,6-mannosyltransferase
MIAYGSDLVYPGTVYRPLSRWLFRRVPQILAISKATRELLSGIGVQSERIEIVPPGVTVEDFEAEPQHCAEELMQRLEGRRIVLSVGRLVPRKGLVEFVEHVMPILSERVPDVALVIAGDDAIASLVHDEKVREPIEEMVRKKGLEKYVILTGTLPYREIVKLFFRSDVFILPAVRVPGDAEGFGIVFLEAALAGSPTVSTRIGGIPDAVLDGETGLLVEPGDYEGLCTAVCRILTDEELRNRLASAAETRARNEYSWDAITVKYVNAFRKIVP